MAVMWPRQLPQGILRDDLRAAERKVYDRLRSQLGADWVVFYSRPWLGLTATGQEIDGEADFVVASPQSGFLTIEVKGGAVSYDPVSDEWLSRDRHGIRHRIKNPVAQARSSKYELLRKLRESAAMANHHLRIRHAVVFPDSASPGQALGPDMPLDLFCFQDRFETSLGQWIETRLGLPSGPERPLGARGIQVLEGLLAKPFQLKVPLAHLLNEDEESLRLLTPTQYRILTAIDAVHRAAVAGGAGTGKTILALEKARKCAESGRRTLLTCFNRPLAAYLAARTRGVPNLDVATFHATCRKVATDAGLSIAGLDPEAFPDMIAEAVRLRPTLRYDSVIIDEAQDLPPHWWIAIDDLLNDKDTSDLYAFLDANQRVYPLVSTLPTDIQLVPIRLDENLRNTQRIHEASQRHYGGPIIRAVGPEGQPVEWMSTGSRSSGRQLEACITRLLSEGISPGDIAVLGSTTPWPVGNRLVGQQTVSCENLDDASIVCDTIRRFKGLERAVVVVMADDVTAADAELAYVALSRPRSLLTVIGNDRQIEHLRRGIDPPR